MATADLMNELKHSKLVGKAIQAAMRLEIQDGQIPWPDGESSEDESESDDSEREVIDDDDEDAEHALITYKFALIRLGRQYPDRCFITHPLRRNQEMTTENSVRCPCGVGRICAWPWQLRLPGQGFCECGYGYDERCEWMQASLGESISW